jgi:hypothetical protein
MDGRTMNDDERLQLQKMISANDTTDQTNLIRKLKHSDLIKQDLQTINALKISAMPHDQMKIKCIESCNFLYTNYTDIFNRLINNEINLSILYEFIGVLTQVENGTIDQHDGSFKIGNLLKSLYVDSAVKKADALNKLYDTDTKTIGPEIIIKKMSWAEFKAENMIRSKI